MFTLNPSNLISLIRAPLAFLFMIDNAFYRCLAIVLAMVTDGLDGYLARRFKMKTQLGAFLDPFMDKLFVFIASLVFLGEQRLKLWEMLALISRDFAVLIFGGYLAFKGAWGTFRFQSILFGKISTALQFFVLLGLTFHLHIPALVFISFIILGALFLFELIRIERQL